MELTLPLPPSINSMYSQSRAGFRFKTNDAKKWTKEAIETVREQKYKTIEGKVDMSVTFYFGRNGKNDIDSRIKSLLDMLTEAEVWKDDSQVYSLLLNKDFDKDKPRVEVTILEN